MPTRSPSSASSPSTTSSSFSTHSALSDLEAAPNPPAPSALPSTRGASSGDVRPSRQSSPTAPAAATRQTTPESKPRWSLRNLFGLPTLPLPQPSPSPSPSHSLSPSTSSSHLTTDEESMPTESTVRAQDQPSLPKTKDKRPSSSSSSSPTNAKKSPAKVTTDEDDGEGPPTATPVAAPAASPRSRTPQPTIGTPPKKTSRSAELKRFRIDPVSEELLRQSIASMNLEQTMLRQKPPKRQKDGLPAPGDATPRTYIRNSDGTWSKLIKKSSTPTPTQDPDQPRTSRATTTDRPRPFAASSEPPTARPGSPVSNVSSWAVPTTPASSPAPSISSSVHSPPRPAAKEISPAPATPQRSKSAVATPSEAVAPERSTPGRSSPVKGDRESTKSPLREEIVPPGKKSGPTPSPPLTNESTTPPKTPPKAYVQPPLPPLQYDDLEEDIPHPLDRTPSKSSSRSTPSSHAKKKVKSASDPTLAASSEGEEEEEEERSIVQDNAPRDASGRTPFEVREALYATAAAVAAMSGAEPKSEEEQREKERSKRDDWRPKITTDDEDEVSVRAASSPPSSEPVPDRNTLTPAPSRENLRDLAELATHQVVYPGDINVLCRPSFQTLPSGIFFPERNGGKRRTHQLNEEDIAWAEASYRAPEDPRLRQHDRHGHGINVAGNWARGILSPVLSETESSVTSHTSSPLLTEARLDEKESVHSSSSSNSTEYQPTEGEHHDSHSTTETHRDDSFPTTVRAASSERSLKSSRQRKIPSATSLRSIVSAQSAEGTASGSLTQRVADAQDVVTPIETSAPVVSTVAVAKEAPEDLNSPDSVASSVGHPTSPHFVESFDLPPLGAKSSSSSTLAKVPISTGDLDLDSFEIIDMPKTESAQDLLKDVKATEVHPAEVKPVSSERIPVTEAALKALSSPDATILSDIELPKRSHPHDQIVATARPLAAAQSDKVQVWKERVNEESRQAASQLLEDQRAALIERGAKVELFAPAHPQPRPAPTADTTEAKSTEEEAKEEPSLRSKLIRRLPAGRYQSPDLTEEQKAERRQRRKTGNSVDVGKGPEEGIGVQRAHMYKKQQDYVKKRDNVKALIELEPENPTPRVVLGKVYLHAYHTVDDRSYLDKARDAFQDAIGLEKDYVEAHRMLATVFEFKNEPINAEQAHLRLFELEPTGYIHLLHAANVLAQTRIHSLKSMKHFLRLVDECPGSRIRAVAHYSIGIIYEFYEENHGLALVHYEACLRERDMTLLEGTDMVEDNLPEELRLHSDQVIKRRIQVCRSHVSQDATSRKTTADSTQKVLSPEEERRKKTPTSPATAHATPHATPRSKTDELKVTGDEDSPMISPRFQFKTREEGPLPPTPPRSRPEAPAVAELPTLFPETESAKATEPIVRSRSASPSTRSTQERKMKSVQAQTSMPKLSKLSRTDAITQTSPRMSSNQDVPLSPTALVDQDVTSPPIPGKQQRVKSPTRRPKPDSLQPLIDEAILAIREIQLRTDLKAVADASKTLSEAFEGLLQAFVGSGQNEWTKDGEMKDTLGKTLVELEGLPERIVEASKTVAARSSKHRHTDLALQHLQDLKRLHT